MASNCENVLNSLSVPTEDPQSNQSTALECRSAFNDKAKVVGLYGVPGSGKTFLLDQLKEELGQEHFAFYEGSKMIARLVPGGLDVFQKLEEQERVHWRQLAIDAIGKECADSGRVAVVAGHFMFWPEEKEAGQPVHTRNDLDTFTHILYLDVPAELVAQRCLNDIARSRPSASINHIRKWQQAEKAQLRHLCYHHSILFSLVSPHPTLRNEVLLNNVSTLLRDFRYHTEERNLSRAQSRMDDALVIGHGQLETVLVMDADRTLSAQDSGVLFWKMVSNSQQSGDEERRLKMLFSSPLGYSYTAFRQAALLYEETADDDEFHALCEEVALSVTMYPEFVSLLQLVAEQEHVGAVVVTCGLRRVWEKVLEREGLAKTVKVIGGGRIGDGLVVTAAVKAAMVARLRDTHHMNVWAFGDSVLDLPMLSKADQAIVVVGEEQTRSKTMDAAVLSAVDNDGLSAKQALLPSNASPRLDTTKLPLIQLTDPVFIDSILCHHSQHGHQGQHGQYGQRSPPGRLLVLHATKRNAAKLLMTPMRDAAVAGPVLREAHRRVGWYLATEFLGEMIGVEEHPIPHVQGHQTSGYRLCHEKTTSIVALMRGGEAMAFGVNEAFPSAMFVHATRPEDIEPFHLLQQHTVVLVDSVVNSGKTIVNFVQHIHGLHATIHIVVVAGVVQAQSVSEGLAQAFAGHSNFSLIALRLSDNKFTGRGTTDTGNRLFNTTDLS
ncbi:uracil phosphoribosyltransferase-domain-containing protein [Amylocarpus encephaloides]|uniref:Uracil phosphoribosyltransferase-domain-containing protein n=1 Tax=Amylocarpus encephaloides TaxID=45428 RepID=A0A9P7YF39_9HELO|nr:uracil phosphoribosyltransferase-domain-containing protein [Amylocarpus encephaloides]